MGTIRSTVVAFLIWVAEPKSRRWCTISFNLRARKKIRIAHILWFLVACLYAAGVGGSALMFEMEHLAVIVLSVTGAMYLWLVHLGIRAWKERLETIRDF